MVNLTRIYTRTGDAGTTALVDGNRVSKTDLRLASYADVDETNCTIGVALASGDLTEEVSATLERIQNDLFDVGADLGNPLPDPDGPAPEYPALRVTQEYVDDLEAACDHYNEALEPLRSFILPGGSVGAAHLHVARATCRRAERTVWAAIEAHGSDGTGGINILTATYLNRLSDLLFILCRYANLSRGGDVLWVPGGGRTEAPEKRSRRSRHATTDAD